MQAWEATALSPDLRVDVVPRTEHPDAETLERVDRIWSEAVAERPSLFNGRVFSADRVSPGCIVGHWTEFRFAFAQIREPALFARLGVRSVAVCGVLRCPDGIVFGRRAAGAIYQAGQWQCPPAGSIERREGAAERVDLAAQLLAELEEELGLRADEVAGLRPLSAVEHPGTHVIDVGMALETAVPGSEIGRRQRAAAGAAEYDEIAVVPLEALERQVESWAGRLVPPARSFLSVLLAD